MIRRAITTLILLLPGLPAQGRAAEPDPLAFVYGNTLMIRTPGPGEVHLWLDQTGRFTRFGGNWGAQQGTYQRDAAEEGAVRVCLHPDTPGLSRAAAFPGTPTQTAPATVPDCLILAPHSPGDTWQQPDPASPDAPQRLSLLPGHQ